MGFVSATGLCALARFVLCTVQRATQPLVHGWEYNDGSKSQTDTTDSITNFSTCTTYKLYVESFESILTVTECSVLPMRHERCVGCSYILTIIDLSFTFRKRTLVHINLRNHAVES